MRNRKGKSGRRDPDIANAEAALRRAALKARERARRAGLKVPVYRNGQVVEEWPDVVLQGRGFTMRQVGRHIIMNTHRSPEEHKSLMTDLRELRVSLPETLRQEVKQLEELLFKYNSFDLLANLMFLEVFIDAETYKEYSHEGMQVVVEYAALLYLKYSFNVGTEIVIDGKVLQEIQSRIRRILSNTMFYHVAESVDETREGPPPKIDELRFRTILNELFVRGPGYPHHMREVLAALFTPVDPWLLKNLGFSISDALAIDDDVSRLVPQKLFDRRDEAVRAKEQMLAELQEYRASKKVKNEDHRETLERLSKMSSKRVQKVVRSWITAWVSSFLGTTLSLGPEEIASETNVPIERVQACLRCFSTEFGSVDTDFYMLTPTHELKMHPFLHHDGKYLCPNPGLFLGAIQLILESALNPDIEGAVCQDKKLWERYKDARADYLERESLKLFGEALKHAEVYHKLNYEVLEEGEVQLTELDGLILYDGNLFLLEAKAGGFTLAGKRGAKDRMLKHLRDIFGKAQSQALRAKKYIDTTETPKFVLKNGKEVVIDKTKVRRTFLVTVSLEPLNVFSTTLHETAELGILGRAQLPWAVSLLDLRVICEMMEFPAQFVHYLCRRLRLNEIKRVSAADELDWFGHYISEGLYFEKFEQSSFDFFRLQAYTTEFDDYYLYETGQRETPAPKPVQPMPERLREIIRELEAVHAPGYSEVVCKLLDLDSETREQFAKQFDRIRALNRSDGLKHDFTLVFEQEESGISCLATSMQQREEAFRRLSGYSALKKYQARAKEWLGILTVGDDPDLVHQWIMYRFPWNPDEKLEAAVASLPSSTEGQEGARSQ